VLEDDVLEASARVTKDGVTLVLSEHFSAHVMVRDRKLKSKPHVNFCFDDHGITTSRFPTGNIGSLGKIGARTKHPLTSAEDVATVHNTTASAPVRGMVENFLADGSRPRTCHEINEMMKWTSDMKHAGRSADLLSNIHE
jgi:hypothetical protein